MKFILTRLILANFKGIRSLDISFTPTTSIFGANASGKTTVADAFFWLLFDKDSTDRKDFEIKTLDENNRPYHKLEHEVTAHIMVDGVETVLRKSLREKWIKPRGSKDEVFGGHETAYFWNDVPLKKNEYQDKIAALVNETTFKLLTNPLYFNNMMKWQERRNMLLQIAGNITDTDVFSNNDSFIELQRSLGGKLTIEEKKKELAAKKKKLRDELDLLPARIDEAKRSLPEEQDYNSLIAELADKNEELARIEDLLLNSSRQEKERQEQLGDLHAKKQNISRQLLDIEFNLEQQVKERQQQRIIAINAKKQEQSALTHQMNSRQAEALRLDKEKASLEQRREKLLKGYDEINASQLVFNENDFCCPTCRRSFDAVDVETKKSELQKNFNDNKSRNLAENIQQGKSVAADIAAIGAGISNLQDQVKMDETTIKLLHDQLHELETANTRLSANEAEEVKKGIVADANYQALFTERRQIEEQLNTPVSDNGKAGLLSQKQQLRTDISYIESLINTKAQREKTEARITELTEQESKMAQELASLEGIEYSIEQFTKAKMDMLEQRVNGLFQTVRFKMFEEQINGGQADTCVALINGVPFSDANTAAKLNAGVDIINVLSAHFGVSAPIFIDNRESVVDLIYTDSQVINLFVSAKDKKLRVQLEEATAAVN